MIHSGPSGCCAAPHKSMASDCSTSAIPGAPNPCGSFSSFSKTLRRLPTLPGTLSWLWRRPMIYLAPNGCCAAPHESMASVCSHAAIPGAPCPLNLTYPSCGPSGASECFDGFSSAPCSFAGASRPAEIPYSSCATLRRFQVLPGTIPWLWQRYWLQSGPSG